jgi:hypothetical protein
MPKPFCGDLSNRIIQNDTAVCCDSRRHDDEGTACPYYRVVRVGYTRIDVCGWVRDCGEGWE